MTAPTYLLSLILADARQDIGPHLTSWAREACCLGHGSSRRVGPSPAADRREADAAREGTHRPLLRIITRWTG